MKGGSYSVAKGASSWHWFVLLPVTNYYKQRIIVEIKFSLKLVDRIFFRHHLTEASSLPPEALPLYLPVIIQVMPPNTQKLSHLGTPHSRTLVAISHLTKKSSYDFFVLPFIT